MKKFIIIFLAFILLVGFIFSIATATENLINNIQTDKKNEEHEQITPEEPEEPEVDPSLTLINFEGVNFKNNSNSVTYTSELGSIHLKAGTYNTDGTSLYFGIQPDTYESILAQDRTSIDPYALIGPTYGVKDYYAIVYDLDITIDEGYNAEFGIRPHYRNPNNNLANTSDTLVRYRNGSYYILGTTTALMKDVPNSYHYTYVLWFDGSFDVYIDGVQIYHAESAYKPECVTASGLRLTFNYFADVENEVGVTFDNIKIKTFDLSYRGAITDLYNDRTMQLQNNSDTVLGGGY